MNRARGLLSAIISACALSLAIPNEILPFGSSLIGLVALIPLYLALVESPSWAWAGLLGGTMTMLVHLLSSFWLANFKEFAIFTLGASSLAYFLIGIVIGWMCRLTARYPAPARPFAFAAYWMLWEFGKSSGFLAYPWGTLVMTSRGLGPLIQIADITGTWGISFLIALISASLAEILRSTTRSTASRRIAIRPIVPSLALAFALVAAASVYGAYQLAKPRAADRSIALVLVQQNGNSWEGNGTQRMIQTSQRLTREAIERVGRKPDLVVWSESVLAYPYVQNREYYRLFPRQDPFAAFLAETGVPLLAGSAVLVDPANRGYSNSVVLIGPDGEQLDWYAKIQLVCFAEYMPFTEYEWVRKTFDTLVGFSSGWVPGTELKTLAVRNAAGDEVRFAAPICFEDAFSALCARLHNAGSDLMINLTNDSWSLTKSAEYQHFTVASFRAIELRTPLVRSTNGGYTTVIDPLGRVTHELPLFTEASLFADVPLYPRTTTVYARFGDWFPSVVALLLVVEFLLARRWRVRPTLPTA